MLPGRTYSPATILWILRKRKWLMIGPSFLFVVTAIWVSIWLPDRYRAQTTIMVVPQRVPENYIRPAVSENIEQRLLAINPQILSESRLERIIIELDLEPARRAQPGGMPRVVQEMRDSIGVEIIKGDLFRITYAGESPYIVMQVTQRLASLFVEENLRDRERIASATSNFLESQLESARTRLEEQERKLQEYRQKYAGQLPSQVGANLQVLQSAGVQLQTLEESLSRDRDRRLELEKALFELQSQAAVPPRAAEPLPPAQAGADATTTSTDLLTSVSGTFSKSARVEALRRELSGLLQRVTADHPDVIRVRRQIGELEKSISDDIAQGLNSAPSSDPVEMARMSRTAQVSLQLAALDKEMARKVVEQTRLREVAAAYQERVNSEPSRESDLISLTRDYDTLRDTYRGLLYKKEEAQISASMERQQISEQFRTLDPARMPERPYAPNRLAMNLVAAAMGMGLSLFLTVVLEIRDQSFRTAPEIMQTLSLPVLAIVPMMITSYEQRRLNRRLALSAGILVLLACAGAGFYLFDRWR